jgi:hypothetical protein
VGRSMGWSVDRSMEVDWQIDQWVESMSQSLYRGFWDHSSHTRKISSCNFHHYLTNRFLSYLLKFLIPIRTSKLKNRLKKDICSYILSPLRITWFRENSCRSTHRINRILGSMPKLWIMTDSYSRMQPYCKNLHIFTKTYILYTLYTIIRGEKAHSRDL